MAMLEVRDLRTSFFTPAGEVKAVNGISFDLESGKVLGIVGESGSGKSVTAYSILQILTHPGRIVGGSIRFKGEELVGCAPETIRKIRGNKISIIFQDPMTSLNPVYTIGNQLEEAIILHTGRNREQAKARAAEMLTLVGINEPEKRLSQYPYELSGGMRQRVMIAMALACKPKLLIADEPTTALDVTIQAQILKLMNELKKEKGTAIMFITHDLGVINQMADDVAVLYCGQVVEMATVDTIFDGTSRYQHPYTEGLMNSIPRLDTPVNTRLSVIPGAVPHPLDLPKGCKFCTRCPYASDKCREVEPEYKEIEPGHLIRCHYPLKEVRHD